MKFTRLQIAKGYKEMETLNLAISKEFFRLEEGVRLIYEMDSEKRENKTKKDGYTY